MEKVGYIFGALAIISGISVLTLPETYQKPLLQTLDESEQLLFRKKDDKGFSRDQFRLLESNDSKTSSETDWLWI